MVFEWESTKVQSKVVARVGSKGSQSDSLLEQKKGTVRATKWELLSRLLKALKLGLKKEHQMIPRCNSQMRWGLKREESSLQWGRRSGLQTAQMIAMAVGLTLVECSGEML